MSESRVHHGRSVEEGRIAVPGGEVWYRAVGAGGGTPLLLLHGGPGVPHDYLTPHDALAGVRRVVYYDQLGCGRSDRPDDASLWTVERFVEELAAVRVALGLDRVHLLGQSWGGSLALASVLAHPEGVRSVTLSSGPASGRRYGDDCLALKRALPADVLARLEHGEQAGETDGADYEEALAVFNHRHICRLETWPEEIECANAGTSRVVYEHMWGPSEWTPTGVLADWDVTDRLGEIDAPVLLLAGRHDTCTPEHVADMALRLRSARVSIFERSSHFPHFEEPEAYLSVLAAFLADVDAGGRPSLAPVGHGDV